MGACGSGGSQSNSSGGKKGGGGKATKKVTFVLDVPAYGKDTPFYVALAKGYWSKRGLDVSIQHGNGSADTVTKVGAGAGQIGFADASAVIQGRANKNINAKMTCMFHYKNLMSAQALASSGIKHPKDLAGKQMITTPGDGDLVLLPALAQINGFNKDAVKITLGDHPSEVPAVVTGKVDGDLDYFTGYPAMLAAAKGRPTTYFLYADYGLDVYNNGIFATEEFLSSDPDTVRAFNEGFVEGVVYTVGHQDEAVDIFQKQVPGLTANVVRAQQQIAINHLNVDEVRQHGFGPMDEKKMQYTLDLDNKYFDLKKPITNVKDVYTNEFVPTGKVPPFKVEPDQVQVPHL